MIIHLDYQFLGNSVEALLLALAVTLLINLFVALVNLVLLHRLEELARRTTTLLDDAAVAVLRRTQHALVFVVAVYAGALSLEIPAQVESVLRTMAVIAAFAQAGLWAGALLSFWISRARDKALATDAGAATGMLALSRVAQAVLWLLIALLVLDNVGVDVTALVAGLGIGGIAIALAVQNILGDLFASLSIVLDKPFVLGDFVVVDGYMGTIEHVGLKTTRIRSLSGEQLVFSNADLLSSRLRNYKRMRERRALFTFGVVYQTTPEQLARIPDIVRNIIEQQPDARFDRAHFQGFGESSLDFEVVYWVLNPDYNRYMDVQQAINLALFREFASVGVDFAYPSRTLFIEGAAAPERKPA